MKNEITKFISNFTEAHPEEIKDLFLHGCCYWFADILERQFGARKCYDPTENHFVAFLDDHIYDIRGCIDKEYDKPIEDPDTEYGDLIFWDKYQEWEPLDSERVIKNCKNFKE